MIRHRFVTDLGVAAYLLMHQFKVIGKRGKAIYFECEDSSEASSEADFNSIILDYMPPNEFYLFDSCLMALKKISPSVPYSNTKDNILTVSDLGQAAYILTKEYGSHPLGAVCIGRGSDRTIAFKVPKGKEENFKAVSFSYLGSPFHTFDSCLMALKKVGEYTPPED